MTSLLLTEPKTGDPVDEAIVVDRARNLASVLDDIAEMEELLKGLRAERDALDSWFRIRGLRNGDRVYAGRDGDRNRYIAMIPPKRRPSRAISQIGATAYREQLLELGLGAWVYRPPTVKDVNDNVERMIAAGIPIEEIVPPVSDTTPGEIKVVEED